MRVIIVGGGIGGLTAALCCQHFGHEVTVLEQAEVLGEAGAGIQLPPNAVNVFRALGIYEAIANKAARPEAIEARMGESGRSIFTIPLAQYSLQRWGAPYLHLHRADYIQALHQALNARAPKALQLGAAVTGYESSPIGVKVQLKNGRQISGDLLVGADGIKSAIRAQMLGPGKPRFTGNIAWRAVVPVRDLGKDAPKSTACVWMGCGRHAVTYRLRGGTLANFVGVVERRDWTQEGWLEKGTQAEALRDFQGWHPVITSLLEAAAPSALYRWALFDRDSLPRWIAGRTVLLGDAAHPMLPFLAQGAAMAVEDSWVLAREISQAQRPLEASLKAYQIKRYERTRRAQLGSRANMKTFHRRSKPAQIITYGPMWLAGKLAPAAVHRRMDWLYGHDVTQE
jgi:salicylate hydroxylase